MSAVHDLHGTCICGRNQYLIVIPPDANTTAEVLFSGNSDDSRTHGGPLSALLRVPLPWLRSTTYAYYPDEEHTAIRRVFTPMHASHTKRHFCGFCGTPLTYWSEESTSEAEMVSVNLSTLRSESVDILAALGVLPSNQATNEENATEIERSKRSEETDSEFRGQPWFEEIIEGSELGRMRRRRGGRTSSGGKSMVEWEVVEFTGDSSGDQADEGIGTGKRKLEKVDGGEDVTMREGY